MIYGMLSDICFIFDDSSKSLILLFISFVVPNSINGKLKIVNTEFLEEYKDHDSPIYHTIAGEIENGLMESLKDYKNVHVRVLNLT